MQLPPKFVKKEMDKFQFVEQIRAHFYTLLSGVLHVLRNFILLQKKETA